MRIGIFSDVHSNLEALERVVETYANKGVDKYICLGDVVGYGANPNECCKIVRDLVEFTVLGNHDAAVSGRMNYSYYYDAAREALDWHANLITKTHSDWLKSLSYIKVLENCAFCHGSPVSPEDFEYVFNLEQARELFPHYKKLNWVTFIGHSHLTKAFALYEDGFTVEDVSGKQIVLDDNKKYIVTVGSVGQPRDYDNRSCYTVFDMDTSTVTYHRVEYNIQKAATKIFKSKLVSNFGKRLYLGI